MITMISLTVTNKGATMSSGYVIRETEGGLPFDISYDPETRSDVIEVDGIESTTIYLTRYDLVEMLEALE